MADIVTRYREMQDAIEGCHDGYCVIKKPKGMHTNRGCKCLMDLKLHEASRIGHLLRIAQQMADEIERLRAQTQWNTDMEAAKEAGSVILFQGGKAYAPCEWQPGGVISEEGFWLWWQMEPEYLTELCQPTAWMPLPPCDVEG